MPVSHNPATTTPSRLCFAAAVLFSLLPWINAMDAPAPLPPPPELLEDMDYGLALPYLEPTAAGETVEETRAALEPPAPVAVTAPASRPAPVGDGGGYETQARYLESYHHYLVDDSQPAIAVQAAPTGQVAARTVSPFVISPPSQSMPADYFNLPMVDEGIPGVLLPELDDDFVDPGLAAMPVGRPRHIGMSIRQLEPWFALAKGSEGEALEARQRGDEPVSTAQLRNAIQAYMDIVEMADAGHEAREEAWYGVARCEYRMGNWWRAFDALERSFPQQFEKSEVAGRIKLEMYIGERLWRMGSTPVPDAVVDGRQMTGYQAASRVYAAAVYNQPTAEDAPLALLRRGDAAAMDEEWQEAAKYYRQVVQYFPESEQAMQARSSLTEAVYRQDWPAGFPEAARSDVASIMDDVERADARLSREAEERRQRAVVLANELEADTKLRHAKEYLRHFRVRKSRDAAVFLLGDVVSYYPGTPQAEEAAGMLREMGIEPPMQISDGTRFPLTSGWSGRELAKEGGGGEIGGGQVRLEGQVDNGGGVLPPSPTRETVYEDFNVPGVTD